MRILGKEQTEDILPYSTSLYSNSPQGKSMVNVSTTERIMLGDIASRGLSLACLTLW